MWRIVRADEDACPQLSLASSLGCSRSPIVDEWMLAQRAGLSMILVSSASAQSVSEAAQRFVENMIS